MSREIIEAVRTIEREKGIESDTLVHALEDALLAAYKKPPGASRHATVEIDEQGDFRVYSIELPADIEERLLDEARERKLEELEALEAETGERSHTLISDDDLDIDWSEVPEDQIKREDVTPDNFGRIAAQTAKQVILQRIREAERAMMYDEYVDRVSEVVTGIVQQAGDRNNVLVDPVGACVGPRGSRVRMVVSELRGEKIDIIPWNPEPARFVAKALSPARVREVYLDDEGREATVVVPDDQLALAIGKEGMNARLAARLTGWKVDIKSDTEFATEEAEAAYAGEGDEEEEFTGRCAAILSTGKRCPNAALPGSRYCGVPAHQELAHKEAELPAEAPQDTPLATQEEVEQAEPVARVEEPAGDVAVATPFPREDVVEGVGEREAEERPAGIPVEPAADAPERPETPVADIGVEQTLEGHETTTGEPPAS